MDPIFYEHLFTLLVGIAMVTTNIGARYLVNDMTPKREKLLTHPNMKYLYVFCMGFVATRNPVLAIVIVALYYLFLKST